MKSFKTTLFSSFVEKQTCQRWDSAKIYNSILESSFSLEIDLEWFKDVKDTYFEDFTGLSFSEEITRSNPLYSFKERLFYLFQGDISSEDLFNMLKNKNPFNYDQVLTINSTWSRNYFKKTNLFGSLIDQDYKYDLFSANFKFKKSEGNIVIPENVTKVVLLENYYVPIIENHLELYAEK